MTVAAFAIIIGLVVATIFATIHAHTKRIAAEEYRASNARVLREFKRISIHTPHHIIDNPRRNHDH